MSQKSVPIIYSGCSHNWDEKKDGAYGNTIPQIHPDTKMVLGKVIPGHCSYCILRQNILCGIDMCIEKLAKLPSGDTEPSQGQASNIQVRLKCGRQVDLLANVKRQVQSKCSDLRERGRWQGDKGYSIMELEQRWIETEEDITERPKDKSERDWIITQLTLFLNCLENGKWKPIRNGWVIPEFNFDLGGGG